MEILSEKIDLLFRGYLIDGVVGCRGEEFLQVVIFWQGDVTVEY